MPRHRVVVVGGGFAGFHALRRMQRLLPADVELMLISPTDYLLYSPLLPEVAAGIVQPRNLAVSLHRSLPRVQLVLGHVVAVNFHSRRLGIRLPDGTLRSESWDRLVLAPGSVTRRFDIPGVAKRAHGLKTLAEAIYLRDHVLRQLDLADAALDPVERQERLTVVAVGAGYTGTEVVAQMQHWLRTVAPGWRTISVEDIRWVLVDRSPTLLPELGQRLGAAALRVLQKRGVEIRLGVTIAEAGDRSVTLTDGTVIPTRTLVWGAGTTASPLIATLGRPTVGGRLVVDANMRLPGRHDVWALGDAAAVPDLTRPTGPGNYAVSAMTAQNAQRQGRTVARNVAASFGRGFSRPYRHRDLGLAADFGGKDAIARPLGVSLRGIVAKAVARGYHLMALPSLSNRMRVLSDWILDAVLAKQMIHISAIRPEDALVADAQNAHIYEPASQPTNHRGGRNVATVAGG